MIRLFGTVLLWSAVFVAEWETSHGDGIECERTICTRRRETLECPHSRILVGNVTTEAGQRDDVMLQKLKRRCMGRVSCDLSKVCDQSRDVLLRRVTFLCVNPDKVEDNTCSRPVQTTALHGFLQSPGYPAPTQYRPCRWMINPAKPSSAVHLVLHDLDYQQKTIGLCDGGLHLTFVSCEYPKQSSTRLLCANDSGRGEEVRVVSCGTVEVQLRQSYSYPLRFWISYTVKDSVIAEPVFRTLGAAGLVGQCPSSSRRQGVVVSSVTMATTAVDAVTSFSGVSDGGEGESDKDSTLTVLIVLVCVIGSIALTLSVILVVVCIRRRRPKVELIEHVYALPSACEPLSHTPLGDHARHPPHRAVTPPPPRPKLIEQYSDVADAVPTGRDVTPASPGYAEVEEVCDINSDESTIKRFQFRQRKQPSVSSSSTTYEDVNPIPTCAANGTVPNSDTRHEQQKKTATTSKSRETPVYVHVVDSPEQISCTTQTTHKQQQLNKDNGSGIAPLAAKFSANAAAKPTDNKSAVDKKGKTGLYSSRLYPLQEGRVASLVSTLDRGQLKKNAKSAAQSNRNSAS